MPFVDAVPSTGEADPYMHIFMDAGMGNVLAFFELPTRAPMGRDENTPVWTQHIALEVESVEVLLAAKARLEAAGIEVVGPTDHALFQSIYFFDPSGHRLELAANTHRPGMLEALDQVKWDMLEEWAQTKKAPRHAAWMHDGRYKSLDDLITRSTGMGRGSTLSEDDRHALVSFLETL